MAEVEFKTSSELLADDTRLARVRAELDLYATPELERALEPRGAARDRVVYDLIEGTFRDSSGLRILVGVDRTGDALEIVANRQAPLLAIEVSGLDRHLAPHPSMGLGLNGAPR